MISVVIPTHRKPRSLERCLAALAGQTAVEDWELVVVDDGSGDTTPDVLRHWGRRLPLRVVGPASNEGRARARNRGWRSARGEFVLFLDDDILLEPWAVAAHENAQRSAPGVWLGEVRTLPEIVDSALFEYLDTRGIAKHAPGSRVPARYLLTQNVSIPRAALERIGGFDEEFGAYGFEDMELGFRLEDELGLECHFLDTALGWHAHHHSLDEYFRKKRICGRETLPRLLERHPQRRREMQLDLVLPGPDTPLRVRALGALLRLSYRSGLAGPVRWLVGPGSQLLPSAGRSRAFDYLVLAAYHRGLGDRDTANMTVS